MTAFTAILNVLTDAQVKFVLVGGYAAMLHGSTYLTRDLDIRYERTASNLDRLATALAPLHPNLRGAPEGTSFVLDSRGLMQGMNFTLERMLATLICLESYPEWEITRISSATLKLWN